MVGCASLCRPADLSLNFQIVIHGTDLHTLSEDGQMLLAIYKVSIFDEFHESAYQCNCPGIEEIPRILGGTLAGDMYIWDAHCLSTPTSPEEQNTKCSERAGGIRQNEIPNYC